MMTSIKIPMSHLYILKVPLNKKTSYLPDV